MQLFSAGVIYLIKYKNVSPPKRMLGYLLLLLGAEIGGEVLLHAWAKSNDMKLLWLGVLAYVCLAVAFAFSMRQNTMTTMNTAWQCANVVIIALFGVFVLKERITRAQTIGICLATLAVTLMFF